MKYTYRVFQDNAGFLHLAVLSGEECVYYFVDMSFDFILYALDALRGGRDPVAENWENGEDFPDDCYREIIAEVDAHNGGAEEVFLYTFAPNQGEPEYFRRLTRKS